MFQPLNPHYEMSDRIKAFDESLELLKIQRSYHETDHVLNLAYNALCGGTCLKDLELRRNCSGTRRRAVLLSPREASRRLLDIILL